MTKIIIYENHSNQFDIYKHDGPYLGGNDTEIIKELPSIVHAMYVIVSLHVTYVGLAFTSDTDIPIQSYLNNCDGTCRIEPTGISKYFQFENLNQTQNI